MLFTQARLLRDEGHFCYPSLGVRKRWTAYMASEICVLDEFVVERILLLVPGTMLWIFFDDAHIMRLICTH